MEYINVLLIISLVIFLFALYALSHEDYLLLRKNVPMERVFNGAFLSIFAGLFVSRVFYAFSHFSPRFLNPLVFLVFPYFPGLSFIGGLVGGGVFVWFYAKQKRLPNERLFDLFSLSCMPAVSVTSLVYVVITLLKKTPISISLLTPFFYGIVSVVLIRLFTRGKFKDGSIGFLVLALSSFYSLATNIIKETHNFVLKASGEDLVFFIVFLFSLFLFTQQEKLLHKITNR